MSATEKRRIAIIGAGPIGLEAALYGRRLAFSVTVFERGRVGEYVQQWGHVRLFSPFGLNATPLGRSAIREEFPEHSFPDDNECITGRQHHAAYIDPLSKLSLLKGCIHAETQVMHVGRHRAMKADLAGDPKRGNYPFRLLLREKGKERTAEADIVLDCSGVYGRHRWLGNGGIPAVGEMAAEPHIRYGLEDIIGEKKSTYAGKTVLVIGGGYSAAATVCQLAELAETHNETWVIWLSRTQTIQPIKRIANDPLRERDRLAAKANMLATRGDANVEFHAKSVVQAVTFNGPDKGFRVHALVGQEEQTFDVERLVANVGYAPDSQMFRELQVQESVFTQGSAKLAAALESTSASDCLQQTGHGADSLRTTEPGFFILGMKSYGRNASFLLRNGFDQVRDVFTAIVGKPVRLEQQG